MLVDALIRALAASLTLGVWAVIVALAWSRPREPRNRRVHRDVSPPNVGPRNVRRASASESCIRSTTPKNVRAARRRGECA